MAVATPQAEDQKYWVNGRTFDALKGASVDLSKFWYKGVVWNATLDFTSGPKFPALFLAP